VPARGLGVEPRAARVPASSQSAASGGGATGVDLDQELGGQRVVGRELRGALRGRARLIAIALSEARARECSLESAELAANGSAAARNRSACCGLESASWTSAAAISTAGLGARSEESALGARTDQRPMPPQDRRSPRARARARCRDRQFGARAP
jgi:hypothetical protein